MYADRRPRGRPVRRIRRRFVHRGPFLDVDAEVSITYEDAPSGTPADDVTGETDDVGRDTGRGADPAGAAGAAGAGA
jgi:hypothetical protein